MAKEGAKAMRTPDRQHAIGEVKSGWQGRNEWERKRQTGTMRKACSITKDISK
jgi:hypothetical protein